ncbi:coproporphyrinogen III oxidase family protein [Shewanella polaris]|uniref:Coproporphyrinogen III oxidase family protein n=1 Tax=Shewanella polaris TaxID=2588449 RepID=A0A4Y5YEP2_9GAMM|nr:coproporphyrinogen III oxidase family protein [Shewanella polaris]QDE31058.1 coproporphyrinogen III oxidase family protein [Shewanella polaris]
MNKFLSSSRLNIATNSLDWVMGQTIRHSLNLNDAVAIDELQQLSVPDKPIETLYIHIPFCHTLCRYCSFHKIKFKESLAREYFKALRQEIRQVITQGFRFNRVYIGGGTTTILEDELIETIELIKSLTTVREVTCESDPIYFKEGNPHLLKGLVDRMSIGIQSFDDNILKMVGRFEKFGSGLQQAEYVSRAIEIIPTVNIDMMYGFKVQTPEAVAIDLAQAIRLHPDQITTYPLTLGIGKNRKKAGCLAGEPEALWPQFLAVKAALAEHYVMEFPWTFSRNFGQPVENKYVLDGEDCFGVGSGAFGRFGEQFRISSFDIPDYIDRINTGLSGTCYTKPLQHKALSQHYFMMMMGYGLLDNQQCKAHTGKSLWQAFPLEMSFLISAGALRKQGDNYITTDEGQFIALKMFSGFLSGMDYLREQARELPINTIDTLVRA